MRFIDDNQLQAASKFRMFLSKDFQKSLVQCTLSRLTVMLCGMIDKKLTNQKFPFLRNGKSAGNRRTEGVSIYQEIPEIPVGM